MTPSQEDKKAPFVKLSEGKFVLPAEGVDINKKCPVQVNVEIPRRFRKINAKGHLQPLC